MQGSIIHGHPIIGGYFARVGKPIFDYYDTLPFVSYMLDITDRGNYNPIYEKPKDPLIYPFEITVEEARVELDFLNIGYVVVKKGEPYSTHVERILNKLSITVVMEDDNYILYQRTINFTPKNSVSFGSDFDFLHIGR